MSNSYPEIPTTSTAHLLNLDRSNGNTTSSIRNHVYQSLIDFVLILVVMVAFILVNQLLNPRIRGFYCNDTDIFYPIIDDIIPFYAVALYGTLLPIICIISVEFINTRFYLTTDHSETSKRKLFFIMSIHAISLFALGVGINLLLTEIGKRWIGRLRPHFIAVCDPDLTQISCFSNAEKSIYKFIDTSVDFCRGNVDDVKEARLSFPSGHSSYAMYTMGFLVFYLEARLFLNKLRFIKPLLQMTALIIAYITAISRISDYHHRGSDVIGGCLLGSFVAFSITCVVGRLLWNFGGRKQIYDIDFKEI